MVIDVNQEPWLYSNKYNEIYHMDLGYKRTCSINNLPQNDVQRIRLRLENLMCIPIENYMSDDSIFFRTTHGDAIIVHKKATKGHAVQKASEIFNIPFAQIIAFGDDTNDIDMLSIVGTGIAMGNANFELKKISNYVTETNDNNGIRHTNNHNPELIKMFEYQLFVDDFFNYCQFHKKLSDKTIKPIK